MKIDKINQIIQESKTDGKDTSQVSDGWHTFSDLYDIRLAYNVALFNEWGDRFEFVEQVRYDVHKSQRHHDGELCFGGGWFIVVANLPSGQISNHYEMKHWGLFRVPETEKAKYEWDRHTSEDVINRLKKPMTNKQRNLIKKKILKCLTENFNGNQAIFSKEGWQVFNGTDLDMVMDAVVRGLEFAKEEYKAEVELLKTYNRWRRGEELPVPDPVEIGKAIDRLTL